MDPFTKIARYLAEVSREYPEANRELLEARTACLKVANRQRAASFPSRNASESLETEIREYCSGLANISQKILRKVPYLTAHRVNEAEHYAETTMKESREKYRIQFGVDACDLDTILVVVKIQQGDEVLGEMELDGALDAAELADRACNALLGLLGS